MIQAHAPLKASHERHQKKKAGKFQKHLRASRYRLKGRFEMIKIFGDTNPARTQHYRQMILLMKERQELHDARKRRPKH